MAINYYFICQPGYHVTGLLHIAQRNQLNSYSRIAESASLLEATRKARAVHFHLGQSQPLPNESAMERLYESKIYDNL